MSVRLGLLLCVLVATALGALWSRGYSPTDLRARPMSCHGSADGAELLALADELGYAGVQLSVRDRAGNWTDCAAGWADWHGLGEAMTLQHRMRYLSLSKVMVSALAVKLERAGRIDLDQRLVDVLTLDAPLADTRIGTITLRHLLTHTAGFDRRLSGDPMMSSDPWCPARVQPLRETRLDFMPGERFAYSNLGYCLLGAALGRKLGKPVAALIQDELLMPVGLSGLLPVANGILGADEARLQVHPAEPFDVLNGLDWDAMHATGAWSGTAAQFGRLMEKVFVDPAGLLGAEGRAQLTAVADDCDVTQWRHCHGLGLYRYRTDGGQTIHWRDGSLNGGTAFFAVADDGQIVVWLANSRQPDWMAANDHIGKAIYRFMNRM